ncbi:hypothetical protein JCM8547_003445 [Rhodosporidiobolus lusitaniae]
MQRIGGGNALLRPAQPQHHRAASFGTGGTAQAQLEAAREAVRQQANQQRQQLLAPDVARRLRERIEADTVFRLENAARMEQERLSLARTRTRRLSSTRPPTPPSAPIHLTQNFIIHSDPTTSHGLPLPPNAVPPSSTRWGEMQLVEAQATGQAAAQDLIGRLFGKDVARQVAAALPDVRGGAGPAEQRRVELTGRNTVEGRSVVANLGAVHATSSSRCRTSTEQYDSASERLRAEARGLNANGVVQVKEKRLPDGRLMMTGVAVSLRW